jgi:hypothetical protein
MHASYFLIGTDGRHYGPLSQDDVRTWLADGRAGRYSRARRDTEDQWTALRDMPEFEEDTRPPHLGGGNPGSASVAETQPESEHRQDVAVSGRLDPVSCFKRAWWLLTRDFALLGGATLLAALLIIGISVIPRVGWLLGLLVNNLLMSGIYVLFLARMRGTRPTANEIALTVRAAALRIVVAGAIQSILTFPVVLASLTQSTTGAAALLLLFVPCLYLLVGYVFVIPLIVDRRAGIWHAMELSRRTVHGQWFHLFGLLLAAGMLLFVSAAALGFGLVLTLPLCTAALMFAYDDLFGGE